MLVVLISALWLRKPSWVSSSPSFTSFICIVLRKQACMFVVIGSRASTVHMPAVLLVHLALTQERRSEFWQKFDGIARDRRVKSCRQGWVMAVSGMTQCANVAWYVVMSWTTDGMEVSSRQFGCGGYSAVIRQRRTDVPLPLCGICGGNIGTGTSPTHPLPVTW